jgi:hypothetical protein
MDDRGVRLGLARHYGASLSRSTPLMREANLNSTKGVPLMSGSRNRFLHRQVDYNTSLSCAAREAESRVTRRELHL